MEIGKLSFQTFNVKGAEGHMKHFFFPNDKGSKAEDLMKHYLNQNPFSGNDEELKVYYDITDIIADKRFEQKDNLLKALVNSAKNTDCSKKENYSRLQALEVLWDKVEQQYKIYLADNKGILYNQSTDCAKQYRISMQLVLYHLIRGNLCIRISQCYYENYELDASDSWAGRGIEIFWHGKNMVAALRDSLSGEEEIQADLYLRLIKLNLAKYYRDYARKNRRSDFDAALDEFKQVRCRVEEEYENTSDQRKKRQYVLIWMDAVINIVKIHRRKYQTDVAEKEILFIYSCLKDRLQASTDQGKEEEKDKELRSLLERIDKVILCFDTEGEQKLVDGGKRLGIEREEFKKYIDLENYDKRRYFLLVLLELARIRRDKHLRENYEAAIAIAIIADEWSMKLDNCDGKHNIDALITISSSLRKYVKFQDATKWKDLPLEQIRIEIDKNKFNLQFGEGIASLSNLIDELHNFANNGHLKSKAEVIKWNCLYHEKPELLKNIKHKLQSYSVNGKNKEEKINCQHEFLNGLLALRSENYGEAINIFEMLLEQKPKEMQYIRLGTLGLKTRYLLANCYMARAEFTKAEKILRKLHDTLATVKKSREYQGTKKGAETKADTETDAETDARVDIDLGYCYMQRGAYEEAIAIYEKLYNKKDSSNEEKAFNLKQVKKQRRIMGLNNYASSCIFSLDDEKGMKGSGIKEKIETARRIFCYMDSYYSGQDNGKEADRYEWNPETNLLKGYYTLCTGVEPGEEPITDEQVNICQQISEGRKPYMRNQALLKAFPYFRRASRFAEAFTSRYDLLDENDMGNKALYRNEVERISVYIISLTKLQKINLEWEKLGDGESDKLFGEEFKLLSEQEEYLRTSKRNLERLVLHFPANYKISLKAAIALAEWLLNFDNETEEKEEDKSLLNQLYCSFSYITIYEERGAGVFNALRNNAKFRLFTAAQRGKLCALLLAMYKPVKTIKEDCCFNVKDKKEKRSEHLVHYTGMGTLKKILTGKVEKGNSAVVQTKCSETKETAPRFRINNCGYMNDVFEGKVFLKSIALVSGDIKSMQEPMQSQLIEKYFPQINRSHNDLLPSGSNVYIGSLSVKADSFPLWNGYSEKESGCNIEFGENFFDIKGIPYRPRALRDYTLSKYSDQDYPLYIVQYLYKQFECLCKKEAETNNFREKDVESIQARGHLQSCGTEAIHYDNLLKILRQISWRWKELDEYLEGKQIKEAASESINIIRAFAADRINEVRFLFKDADYKYEGEVRVIYTDAEEASVAKNNMESEVPRVYVDIERELEDLTIRLASRIEDATVDKYVTWLKHTKRVKKVELAKQNRYTS